MGSLVADFRGVSSGGTRALSEVSATDPAVFAGVVVPVALVNVIATQVPARRAARVEPALALRAE